MDLQFIIYIKCGVNVKFVRYLEEKFINIINKLHTINCDKPMTIIVGLKCVDGVVVGSDSQQEFGRGVAVKRLHRGKIYTINNRFTFAGAGTLAHIEKAVDAINIGLSAAKKRKGGVNLSEDEIVDVMEKSITACYKEYNIDRAKFLGDPREKDFFTPILIGGCLSKVGEKNKACLFIVHKEGVVEKISDYATAGSGAAYAELLLKNYYYEKMTIKEGISVIVHTIGEVKDIDPNCGGITKVTIVNPRACVIKSLTEKQIQKTSRSASHLLDLVEKNLVPKILRGELSEEEIRGIIRKEKS